MQIQPESSGRAAVEAAFRQHRAAVESVVETAAVEHVGATSVPGSLTKGDLDLLVQVPASAMAEARAALSELYEVHQPENWSATFASFKAIPEGNPPVGVQLVVAGSADDRTFTAWRERLTAEPALLRAYNELKRLHADDPYEAYTAAKADFIAAALGPRHDPIGRTRGNR